MHIKPDMAQFGERLSAWAHIRRSLFISGPGMFWVLGFLILPLVSIMVISFLSRGSEGEIIRPFTTENYERFAGFGLLGYDPLFPLIVLRSMLLALATTVLCLACAFPMAFFIARLSQTWKNVALTLVVIPLWTNLLIRTYAWQILLAPDGWLAWLATAAGLCSPESPLCPSLTAVYIGMVCDFLPFLVLPLYTSVEKLDWSLAEAAMDLGADGFHTFRHAVLPQVLPGMVAGCILVFVPATGQFVVPDLLGGARTVLLGNAIQQEFGPSRDWPYGSAIAMLSMAMVMAGLWLYARLESRKGETSIL